MALFPGATSLTDQGWSTRPYGAGNGRAGGRPSGADADPFSVESPSVVRVARRAEAVAAAGYPRPLPWLSLANAILVPSHTLQEVIRISEAPPKEGTPVPLSRAWLDSIRDAIRR